MSENTEPPTPKVRVHRNRAKRRFCRTRLPTPPPDPMACEEMLDQPGSSAENSPVKDVHFLDYINSLQNSPHVLHPSRSDSLFAPVVATEDAFDHLDKLYKLMEQMLNLQQQNSKLLKRVRDLEHLKNLQSMHRNFDNVPIFEDIPELDDDSSFAESLLDAMLSGTKKDVKPKSWARSRLRQSLMKRQRNRSSSLNERAATGDLDDGQNQRRASAGSGREKSSKVSKWTKVKAAFRWEKASPSVSGAKSQDSGIGGILPVNYEVVRYLRVPSTCDDVGISPADSGAADGSTPGTLSSASSADDLHRQEQRGDLQVSDDDRHSITHDDVHLTRRGHHGSSHKKSSVKMRNMLPSYHRVISKHRLSSRSDDMKMDISDNEDLEIEHNSKSGEKMKTRLVKQTSKSREKREIPANIIARYQQAIAEDESRSKHSSTPKRVSKWTRVKKAFLTPAHTSSDGKHKHDHCSATSPSGNRQENQPQEFGEESKKVHEEIQNNYRQLQKKLSLEFQEKLKDWDKLKSTTSSAVSGSHARNDSVADDQRDQAFIKKMEEWQRIKSQPPRPGPNIQMIRAENLAPEFKKKLEEWQKIKKHVTKDDSVPITKTKKKLGEWPKWKSVSGHREEHAPIENPPLTDEFLKKLEEWRKIKETHKHYHVKEKTPSPRLARKQPSQTPQASSSGQSKKEKDHEKELHWFEKELDKIEKEKQRLEQERQKFLQREERLTKLRRTVMGNGNKKDVLIHTPSGFYRFEGISRKFTQKICEWEQAQGIGPEASTFALLTSNFTPHITVDSYETDSQIPAPQYGGPKIIRSKSAESLAIPNFIQPCSSPSHHPSSLSLNDVEELEKQCLALSRESSMQDLDGSLEKLENENDEPEAVIVEVEDVEEETASALEENLQEQHFPVYQREMSLNVCEEQSLVVPCIQRMDSKNAQYSYFLIEEIMKVIKSVEDDESNNDETEHVPNLDTIDLDDNDINEDAGKECQSPDSLKFKDKNELQKQRSDTVLEKLIRLQEIHSKNISGVAVEGFAHTSTHFANLLEAAQDSFSELLQMAEQLQQLLHSKCGESFYEVSFQFTDNSYSDVTAITSELVAKLSELKRILTYFYAASDMTAPGRKIKSGKKTKKGQKCDTNEYKNALSNSNSNNQIQPDQGKLSAKRMRYKKKDYCNKTMYESEDSDVNDQQFEPSRKCEEPPTKEQRDEVSIDPELVEKLVIPTKTNFVNASSKPSPTMEKKPVEVFVKTTRKLFTPVIESQSSKLSTHTPSCSSIELTDQDSETMSKVLEEDIDQSFTIRLPPLPASPTPQRKASKEISPSIRIMLAKYNQIICGQDMSGATRSAGSSGSASPVAWRSPVSERRVKAQRERYLQELKKIGNSEVKKSASVSVLTSENAISPAHQPCTATILTPENNQSLTRGILRSTSVGMMHINPEKLDIKEKNHSLKIIIPECPSEKDRHSPEERYNKLKRAKEKFLNSPSTSIAGPSSAPPLYPGDHDNITKYPTRSRFSQISMGSESSYESSPYEGLLVKSASAGMINVDEITYKKIDPAFHQDGYVSLPRTVQKQKEGFLGGKLALSNIAAKFRKVRMRRSKEQKKMNTVSALCRQSLVVDINSDSQETLSSDNKGRRESLTVPQDHRASSSEDTSPSSSRSGSWIRRSRIFKAL